MVSLDRQGDEGKDSPMVNRMRLEEQVDKDFSLARSKALLGHRGARLKRRLITDGLLCFDEVRELPGASSRIYRGTRTVPVGQIGGSVGRCSEFDSDFMPAKSSVEARWKRIDRAFNRGEQLPPVSLYKVGSFYFVLDGHHRVSVARYHRVEWIEAYVTEYNAPSPMDAARSLSAEEESEHDCGFEPAVVPRRSRGPHFRAVDLRRDRLRGSVPGRSREYTCGKCRR
jgi:hypothetical protein